MTSYRARSARTNSSASPLTSSTWLAFSARRFSSSAPSAMRSRSTMTTRLAPRDAASKPRAPLPEKRSRHTSPVRSCPSQLNTVSRTRSGVGRKSSRVGKWMRRLRHSPPTIRTSLRFKIYCGDAAALAALSAEGPTTTVTMRLVSMRRLKAARICSLVTRSMLPVNSSRYFSGSR